MEVNGATRRPLLRRASFDDYDQIAALEAANGLSTRSREEWLHLWQNNPACQQLPDWPIGWVLEEADGRIVGALENIPCLYRLHGRTYVGAFGHGWAVDGAYRAHALQLLMRQMHQRNVDLFITATASPRTADILTKLGWSQVPVGRWDRSAVWVTDYSETVRRCLAAKAPRFVSSVAAPLLGALSRSKDAVSRLPRSSDSRCKLRWSRHFDERFDQFWNELEERNPNLLLTTRTSQTLEWHFKALLEQNRIWILTASHGSRLVAYAIFERRPTKSLDLERVLLIDFQTLSDDRGVAAAMLSSALERCHQERIHLMENMGCWLEAKQPLVNRPQFRRALEGWCYLYRSVNQDLATELRNPEAWYPTQYDADGSL